MSIYGPTNTTSWKNVITLDLIAFHNDPEDAIINNTNLEKFIVTIGGASDPLHIEEASTPDEVNNVLNHYNIPPDKGWW